MEFLHNLWYGWLGRLDNGKVIPFPAFVTIVLIIVAWLLYLKTKEQKHEITKLRQQQEKDKAN